MATQKQLDAKKKKLEAKKKALEAKSAAAKKTADKAEKRERGVQTALDKRIRKLQAAYSKSMARLDAARRAQYKFDDKIDDLEGAISDVENDVAEEKNQNHVEQGDA